MQTRKCVYCGAIQDNSTHQCLNCGGLVKQTLVQEPKSKNKKIFLGILLSISLVMVLGLFSYKNNTPSVVAVPTTRSLQAYPIAAVVEAPTPAMTHFVMKAKFSQVLAELSTIKMLVVEHYHMTGQYPASLSELGFNEKLFDTGEYIQTIQFSKKGAIQASLAANIFGENKTLILTPKATMGGMNIHWECTSNLEQHIILGICKPIV